MPVPIGQKLSGIRPIQANAEEENAWRQRLVGKYILKDDEQTTLGTHEVKASEWRSLSLLYVYIYIYMISKNIVLCSLCAKGICLNHGAYSRLTVS